LRDLVASHPLLAFVVLSYALSAAWLLSYLINLGTVNGFGVIASTSPALAAMMVSACLRPGASGAPAGKRWRLLAIVSVLALLTMVALRFWMAAGLVTVPAIGASPAPYPNLLALVLDLLAAGVVGYVVSGIDSPGKGVRDLLQSLDPRRPRVRWYWALVAIGLYPAVLALGNAVSAAVGLPLPAPIAGGQAQWLALTVVLAFLYCLFGGGGLEEPGWRGLVLPLLQKRHSPLLASLILGVIWTFWHWPHILLSMQQTGPAVVITLLAQIVPLAILFTAVFRLSGSSLAVVVLLHASLNVTDMFLPASALATGLWALLLLGVAVWMVLAPRMFSGRQTRQVSET
jgi:membrane protease YdiL (CAAX protease family)